MINNKRSKNCDWVAKKPSSLPEEGQERQGQQSRGERGLPRVLRHLRHVRPDSWSKKCVTAGMCANEFDLHEPAPTFFERRDVPVCSQIDGACDDETETSAEIVDVHVKPAPTPRRAPCAFAGDTAYIAVAIENERDEDLGDGNPPQFPAGHVEIFTAKTANSELGVRLSRGRRDDGPRRLRLPEDPEPEFVSVSPGNKAVVTMQENNCVAVVDLPTGAVDFSVSAGARDLADVDVAEEGVIDQTASLAAVTAEPDGVVWIKGGAYFATANEGDMNGGSRSWSVFDGATGALVYDSGNFLEHLAASLGHDPEHRSENKGVEPENIAYGEFPDGAGGTRDFVFVNLERSSLVVVYDVTAFPTITYVQTLPAAMGPEGTVAVPAAGIVLPADGSAPIPFAALSSLTAEAGDLVLAVEDSAYGKSRVFEIDVGVAPAVVVGGARILDSKDVLRSWSHFTNFTTTVDGAVADGEFDAADLAALVNDDKTVNIDPGGVAVGILGGAVKYVVAHEGYGTVGDAGRPVRSLNFLFVLGLSGPDYVIDKVIALPDAQNARQLRFGFEGVAVLDNKIVVAFQRAWGADEFPQMGVYDYAVGGDAGWSFVFYPVDEPSSHRLARAPIMNAGIVLIIAASTLARAAGAQPVSCADPEDGSVASRFVRNTCTANAFDMAAHTIPDCIEIRAVRPRAVQPRPQVSSDMAKQGCWERHIVTRIVPLIRRTMCGPARLDDRVSLYKMGLADSFPGPKMCIWSTNDEINRGNARMTPYFEGRRDFGQDKQKACMEVVYTDTLDHLLFDTHGLARRVDVMKIDIEGFETRAFRGAARLLASDFKPCQIYFEYQHDATVESGVDRHELFERLTRAGYKLNDFMKNEEVGSFTPEQWDGMRGGDLRAVLDDASCGWSSRAAAAAAAASRRRSRAAACCGPEAAAECSICSRVAGDGGVSLVDGVCQEFCSANGYCGVTENYESGDGLHEMRCRRRAAAASPLREAAPPQPALVVVRERTKRIEALEAELAALKTSDALEPRRGARDGFDRPSARRRRRRRRGREGQDAGAVGRQVLNGHRCDRHVDVGDADAAGAVARVGALGFVGVADDWATSVCLFHRLRIAEARAQLAEPPAPGNATDDWADWAVYAAARRRFAELLDAAGASPACARARAARRAAAAAARGARRRGGCGGAGRASGAAAGPFSGGEGNARRWAVTTACDAGDDRLDVAAAEVAVEVEAARDGQSRLRRRAPQRRRRAADGPTGITLRNYGFADHGDVCAKEAFLYLDGISTSNGLKYHGACAPRDPRRRRRDEDLVTAAWPAHAAAAHDPGATLRDKVDYVGADGAGAAAFCASVARAAAWLRRTRGREAMARTLAPCSPSALRARRSSDAAVRNAYAELQVLLLEDRDADAIELRRLFSPAAAADGLYPRSGACAPFRPAAAARRAPAVVAGQGGSGSRSVVELLRACGVEMNGVDGGEDDASSADRRLRARCP
ncbi:hypothetical protein JL722_15166 [Aureococcus anophagefferens]|nr:hypothetical protein JL722_15166 [Aureococcus anophagefferens]